MREAAEKTLFQYENEITNDCFEAIGGIDEAGRGPLAGPVIAACVVLPRDKIIEGINDSKKISEQKREALYEKIINAAVCFGIGIVENEEIDRINILNAAKAAFEKAYFNMEKQCGLVLIDGRDAVDLKCEVMTVINGDEKCYSIAAASIIAKVTRDRMMRNYDKKYPEYGFIRNKGYGTKEHLRALLKYGPCKLHRRTFLKNIDRWLHEEP